MDIGRRYGRAAVIARRRVGPAVGALLAALTLVLGACDGGRSAGPAPRPRPAVATSAQPNIVFVLTDDLPWNLVRYMPHVVALQQRGMTFLNFTTTDSLCCPARASIFTGDFPHDTHVTVNSGPDGGFGRFTDEGDDRSTFATSLAAAGYRTAMLGKYLNHYPAARNYPDGDSMFLHRSYVPPGWTRFEGVNDDGYNQYDYAISHNTSVRAYGSAPSDYLNTVLQQDANSFVHASVDAHQPFLLEVSSFTPHAPYVPAPQDAGTFAGIRAPRPPSFNVLPTNPPGWLRGHAALTTARLDGIDHDFELQVEAVQSVDRLLGSLRRTITQLGQQNNTVFVFSSDNGYHMGQYRLTPGKQTAFDSDVLVPLIVSGPGILAGVTDSHVTENIDLRPTFAQLAGASTPPDVDGRSLVPLLHGEHPRWRTVAAVEHQGPEIRSHDAGDPDAQSAAAGTPPSYDAIRTGAFTFVQYLDGQREYYSHSVDPYQLHNVVGSLTQARIRRLDARVAALTHCHGTASCWQAGAPKYGTAATSTPLNRLCQDQPQGCWPTPGPLLHGRSAQ